MAEDNLQALKSFKKEFEKIRLALNPNEPAGFDSDEPSATDPKFIKALSATVGVIQKRLLDNDKAFLKKFNPFNIPAVADSHSSSTQKISSQLGVLGVPGKDTGELVNALLKSYLLKKTESSGDKAFLEQACKLYNEFSKLPDSLQEPINTSLADIPSPKIDTAPPSAPTMPTGEKKPGETTTTAPRLEEAIKPWLAQPVHNPLFPAESYRVMSENPPNKKHIHNLAEEALRRFVERAAQDGAAFEVGRPSSYPANGIMAITRDNVTKYYDTSNITAAMFGLYKNAKGETVHFKPDLRDVGLAFEGLPLTGIPVKIPNIPAYREIFDKLDPTDHDWGPTTYPRNRVSAFFFGEIDDLPEADRNKIVYRMGHRLNSLDNKNPYFKAFTYEAELNEARRTGKEEAFMAEMESLAHRNASAYAYYRLGTADAGDPDNLSGEYKSSVKKDYLPQRQKMLYEREHGKTSTLDEKFKNAAGAPEDNKPAARRENFKDNARTAGLTEPIATSDPSEKTPALKNPVITV